MRECLLGLTKILIIIWFGTKGILLAFLKFYLLGDILCNFLLGITHSIVVTRQVILTTHHSIGLPRLRFLGEPLLKEALVSCLHGLILLLKSL